MGSDRFYEGSGRSLGKPRPRLHYTYRTKDSRTGRILRVSFNQRADTGIGEWRHDVERNGFLVDSFQIYAFQDVVDISYRRSGLPGDRELERTVYYANSTIGALFLNRGLVGERRIVPRALDFKNVI